MRAGYSFFVLFYASFLVLSSSLAFFACQPALSVEPKSAQKPLDGARVAESNVGLAQAESGRNNVPPKLPPKKSDQPASKDAEGSAKGLAKDGGASAPNSSTAHAMAESAALAVVDGSISPEDEKLRQELKSLSETELRVFLGLRKRSDELDHRTKVVQDRENVVAASQVYIKARMEELKQLQSGVEAVLEEYKKEESQKLSSLVKIYENMKPQDAAQILENLDMNTLLEVIARMKEVKVAPILAKMNVAKAKEATEKFLRVGRGLMSYNNVCSCEILKIFPNGEKLG